jgi:hypothetical protein
MGGRSPTGLNQANQEVRKWCLGSAGQRKHGTTHQQPLVVFEQLEKANLKALPASPYDLALWKEVRLHRDCYVVFENAFYSAPFRLIGQKLRVRAGTNTVKLYDCNYELVATHTRATKAGERITKQDHLPPHKLDGLNQNREGVQVEADGIGTATSQVVKTMLADPALDRLPSAARLVRLGRQYGNHRLEAACQRAEKFGQGDYRTIKDILVKGLEQVAEPEPTPTPVSPYRYARSTSDLLGHLFGKAVGLVSLACSGILLGLSGRGGQLWN